MMTRDILYWAIDTFRNKKEISITISGLVSMCGDWQQISTQR